MCMLTAIATRNFAITDKNSTRWLVVVCKILCQKFIPTESRVKSIKLTMESARILGWAEEGHLTDITMLHAKAADSAQERKHVKIGGNIVAYSYFICQTPYTAFVGAAERIPIPSSHRATARKGAQDGRHRKVGARSREASQLKFNFTCVKLVISSFAIITLKI